MLNYNSSGFSNTPTPQDQTKLKEDIEFMKNHIK